MKSILTLMFILVSMSLIAQDDVYGPTEKKSTTPQAPKKAWKIIIRNSLTADENFTMVGRTLADNDFTIETKDKEFYTIKTTIRDIKKEAGRYFLSFSVRDNVISITGQAILDVNVSFVSGITKEAAFGKIQNRGMQGSFDKAAFVEMQKFALLLGKDLEYVVD